MSSDAFKRRKTSQDNHTNTIIWKHRSVTDTELTWAEIAKLCFILLKFLSSPLVSKEVYIFIFCFWSSFSFWLLLLPFFTAFKRTADCICCHLPETTYTLNNCESDQPFFFFILCETVCIFNCVLMLEHALTEYYVSICFVNLLYSNLLMLEGK